MKNTSKEAKIMFDTLRNMYTFLLLSIKEDKEIEFEDIYIFLLEMDKIMDKIESNF